MLNGAARSGNLDLVEWTRKKQKLVYDSNNIPYSRQPCVQSSETLNKACKSGNVEIIKSLKFKEGSYDALKIAARYGNEEAFFWLYERKGESSSSFCKNAAIGGHFKLAKKLYREASSMWVNQYENELASAGARYGNIEFLEWMKKQGLKVDTELCSSSALKYGQLEILKWLQTENWKCNENSCNYAAESGRIEVVQWAKGNGSEWSEETMTIAASNGHLGLIKWLRANGCPWSAKTTQQAALNGKLQVLKWLIENSCPYILLEDTEYTIYPSILLDNDWVDILGYLLQYGIPLNHNCYDLNSLNWNENRWKNEFIFEHGCKLSPVLWCIAINNSVQQLKWLKEKNCPYDAKETFNFTEDVKISTLEWLQNNGYSKYEYACESVARNNDLKVLKWMRENGWPWSEKVCKKAAKNENFEIFKWAVEAGCPVNFDDCKKQTSEKILNYINQMQK